MNTIYRTWLTDPYFDEETKAELAGIADDPQEIEDRFYCDLEFGTGGLRGLLGAGSNRMNRYTVRRATQGVANVILRSGAAQRGVAVAYDSRRMSYEFAVETALCLAGNGIRAYVFDTLRPTPMLSFAVRHLGCAAGIVITASHNPPAYNGYKVYWEDGGQITYPRDEEIIREVKGVTDYSKIRMTDLESARKKGLYRVISREVDDAYMRKLHELILRPDMLERAADSLRIVYTPLHGAGNVPVRRILDKLGFTHVYVVPEQEKPDGDFPTVKSPNPEEDTAFEKALRLADEKKADLVLATDPDADRLGVYVREPDSGTYCKLTGNMSAALIFDYILSQRKENDTIPSNGALVTTIVSGKMPKAMADKHGVKTFETLTGFKYIGEKIRLFEQTGDYEYIFGFEESYGCLLGTYARDKDAVAAVMAVCEAAAYARASGYSLYERLQELFCLYGYYRETLCTVTLDGQSGAEKIQTMMRCMREKMPDRIGAYTVVACRDYQSGVVTDRNGRCKPTELPVSNVLYYELERGAWCCIRPSGTEPKIKLYAGVCGTSEDDAREQLQDLTTHLRRMTEQ